MSSAVENYLRRKAELAVLPSARECCLQCRKPAISCYCPQVAPIASDPRIVVLIHPLEARHPVGTGRMTHRCLSNSLFIEGVDFTRNETVNAILQDPKLYPMVLFPGPKSVNLTDLSPAERRNAIPEGREPVVIVLDGTWHLAKKMLHRSPNLQQVPRICFTPPRLSTFRVRKQPNAQCFSTIEAVHELLTLLGPERAERPHDILLDVFDAMVTKQLSFRKPGPTRHTRNYFARKERALKLQAKA